MKKIVALVLCAAAAAGAAAQTSVSIGINQPGVYGRVRIGDIPPPALWRSEPVIVAPPRVVVRQQPVYLYVPVAHQQNWRRYCSRYGACGQPVYFVRDEWVRERWAHEHPRHGRHRGWDRHGHGHGHRD
jgi:hypothetical protein